MTFSEEQRRSLRDGDPIPLTIDGEECVLIRKDAYLRKLTEYNQADPEETYPAVLEAWDAVGSPEDAEGYKDLA